MEAIKPYLKLLRMKNWLSFFLVGVLGFLLSGGISQAPPNILAYFVTLSLYLGFAFSINEYFDVEEDKLNKNKKNPVARGEIKPVSALIYSLFLGISSIGLSTYFSQKGILFYLGLILLATFYSAPPLRFKSRPIFDLISHGLFFGALIYILPFQFFEIELKGTDYLIAWSIFHLSLILELRNHLEDYHCDKKANLKTTVCALGLRISNTLAKGLAIIYPLSMGGLFLSRGDISILFLALTAGYYVAFAYKPNYRILDIYANILYAAILIHYLI